MNVKHRRSALSVVCVIALGAFVYLKFGRPMRYEFPGGFRRWVVVHFEDPSCPPLPSRGAFLIISVPTSGHVCTSTRHPDGWIYYRFEYVYPNGKRESLPLHSGVDPPGKVQVYRLTYNQKEKWEVDFVGTKEEAEHWGSPPYPWANSDTGDEIPAQ